MDVLVLSKGRSGKLLSPLEASAISYTALTLDESRPAVVGYLSLLVVAVREVRSAKPDIVVANYAGLVGLLALGIGAFAGCPAVIRLGGDPRADYRDRRRTFLQRGKPVQVCKYVFLDAVSRVVLRFASGFLVVSENLKRRVTTAAACPPSKVVVARPPVDDPLDDEDAAPAPVADAERVVLTVTNLRFEAKYRGVCDALRAMVPVLEEHEDVTYVVAGGGAYHNNVVTRADHVATDPDVRSRLSVPGYVSDISQLYRTADIFLYVSYIDGYPNVVREAQFARLPVIATPGYGAEEQIRDGEDGFIVPGERHDELRRTVEALLADPDERARIGTAARERAVRESTAEAAGRSLAAALDTFAN